MPRTAKHACKLHGEQPVSHFYMYAKTATKPERWICREQEAQRQRTRGEKRKAAKAEAAPKPARKSTSKSTAKKSTAKKPARKAAK